MKYCAARERTGKEVFIVCHNLKVEVNKQTNPLSSGACITSSHLGSGLA